MSLVAQVASVWLPPSAAGLQGGWSSASYVTAKHAVVGTIGHGAKALVLHLGRAQLRPEAEIHYPGLPPAACILLNVDALSSSLNPLHSCSVKGPASRGFVDLFQRLNRIFLPGFPSSVCRKRA